MEASMKEPTLRLVHSSDLHLERPLHGLAEIPDHLREQLIEAPYHAAEQVFETALAEDVDAVLLAGDVLDVDRAGPPAIVLLLEQFARLGDRGIQVYWAGGAVDNPDNWPRSVVLPENVHVFPVGHVQSLDLVRANEIIARVQGVSSRVDGKFDASGFHRDAHGRFTIGVAYEQGAGSGEQGENYSMLHADSSELHERVHYMALGGRHLFQTVGEAPGVAHYCGTPQGRGPTEIGAHGCTLVHVDDTGRARPQFVATDSIRWTEQTLEVTATTKQEQLYERLVERMEKLLAKHPGIDLLVQWKIQGTGPLVNRLRPGGLSDEMLVDLRRRFGHSSQIAWSASLECHSPLSVPAEWYDEETVLGDFVRQVRACEKDENLPFDLTQFLPDNLREESLAAIAHVESHDHRLDLLERAAKLGVDLLTIPLEEGDLPADH
jgi:DNA repair protein SbcD/Mre11